MDNKVYYPRLPKYSVLKLTHHNICDVLSEYYKDIAADNTQVTNVSEKYEAGVNVYEVTFGNKAANG